MSYINIKFLLALYKEDARYVFLPSQTRVTSSRHLVHWTARFYKINAPTGSEHDYCQIKLFTYITSHYVSFVAVQFRTPFFWEVAPCPPSELVLDILKQRNDIKNVGHKLPNDKAPHAKDWGRSLYMNWEHDDW
jgi:hypothetical protein